MSVAQLMSARQPLLFRRVRALLLLTLVVILLWALVHGVHGLVVGASDPPATTARVQPGPAVAPPPPTSQSATAALGDAVAAHVATVPGRLSVAALDLKTGVSATYGTDQKGFATASIVKVDILATLLLQKQGKLSGHEKQLATRMIENSNNAAASALWKDIGGAKGLNAANARFGLTATVPGTRGTWGLTTTTAADQLQLLRVVFTADSPLDADSRSYLGGLMQTIAPDQDWGISAADTRSGTRFHVKNGWMPRSKGWIINSVGSVEHSGHTVLLVALSDGRKGKDAGIAAAETVARDAAVAVTGR